MAELCEETLQPPAELLAYCREQVFDPEKLVMPFGAMCDMWGIDGLVNVHSDSQPPGFWTYLWIIINDGGCRLRELGNTTELPVGRLLRFNGASPHMTVTGPSGQRDGRFVFLAWDMPKLAYPLDYFYEQLQEKCLPRDPTQQGCYGQSFI